MEDSGKGRTSNRRSPRRQSQRSDSRKHSRSPRRSESAKHNSNRSPSKRSNSPVKRLEIVKDDDIEESAVDRKLRELNEERRHHLMKKEQISKKIESKTRELNFLKGLDSDDIIYMIRKKDIYAAKIIQRWWRVRRMRQIFSIETKDKIQQIKAAMKLQKAWRLRKRRKLLRYYQKHNTQRVDHFYDPIPDEKLREYEEKVKTRLKTFSMVELGDKSPEDVEREFISKYRSFYDNYIENEISRRKANYLAHKIDDMLQFYAEDRKVSSLKVWGYDGTSPGLYLDARRLNEKKIQTALSGRLFLNEDDDLDIEGDRLIREIRAYKAEMIANHFY